MVTKDTIVDMLANTSLFAPLGQDDRRAVAQELRESSWDQGQVVFSRGDTGKDIYLVTAGRVRLSILTSEGRELSFAHAEAGQVFGEIAVLDSGQRTADATAVTKVQALTLSKPALVKLMETRPAMRDAVILFLCKRVREADQQLEGIALYPIEARLARFFLAAVRQKAGADADGAVPLDLPISQSELALLIGASRPKVNAALAMLEDQGALDRADGKFTCHIEQLEDIAGL